MCHVKSLCVLLTHTLQHVHWVTAIFQCQEFAGLQAASFEKALRRRGIPTRFSYIKSRLLRLEGHAGSDRYVTVEPLLRPIDSYKKWNSNAGGVRQATVLGMAAGGGGGGGGGRRAMHSSQMLGSLCEDKEEEESDSDDDGKDRYGSVGNGGGGGYGGGGGGGAGGGGGLLGRTPAEAPQAFTHWTYVQGKGTSMVCDIQGVYEGGHVDEYRLTDPVVHTKQGNVMGRTDRGKKGMQQFLATHTCNSMCRALGLSLGAFDDECVICLEVMSDPVTLTCRHMYCRGCVRTLQVSSDFTAVEGPLRFWVNCDSQRFHCG